MAKSKNVESPSWWFSQHVNNFHNNKPIRTGRRHDILRFCGMILYIWWITRARLFNNHKSIERSVRGPTCLVWWLHINPTNQCSTKWKQFMDLQDTARANVITMAIKKYSIYIYWYCDFHIRPKNHPSNSQVTVTSQRHSIFKTF